MSRGPVTLSAAVFVVIVWELCGCEGKDLVWRVQTWRAGNSCTPEWPVVMRSAEESTWEACETQREPCFVDNYRAKETECQVALIPAEGIVLRHFHNDNCSGDPYSTWWIPPGCNSMWKAYVMCNSSHVVFDTALGRELCNYKTSANNSIIDLNKCNYRPSNNIGTTAECPNPHFTLFEEASLGALYLAIVPVAGVFLLCQVTCWCKRGKVPVIHLPVFFYFVK
ncbi:hypothetical protein Pelo_5462 [Pelomyxa schiedti]|nr:hypothetical protein Pelo_5462 [Pelomyxa schiedti]